MSQSSLLLGAGASIDAGVPGALQLTEKVYNKLREHRKEEAVLFGYVVAKLLTKRARAGQSPFSSINIEEVYDALKKFLLRDDDPLNEFVYSWDSAFDAVPLDKTRFKQLLQKTIEVHGFEGNLHVGINEWALDDLIELLEDSFSSPKPRARLEEYVKALCDCLSDVDSNQSYLKDLCRFASEQVNVVGTLNYDLLFENNGQSVGVDVDRGLGKWNDLKQIYFNPGSIKLLKLHGSIDWFEDGDNILDPEAAKGIYRRGMIFGGQGEKLVPHGPYLQLRNEFQRFTQRSTMLGIIGYSFQDIHMNALLRTWMATKRKGKVVVMDPGPQSSLMKNLGPWSSFSDSGKENRRVEVVHIKKSARDGMRDFISEMSKGPDLKLAIDQTNGVRTIQ